jgi:hypothetical protein
MCDPCPIILLHLNNALLNDQWIIKEIMGRGLKIPRSK